VEVKEETDTTDEVGEEQATVGLAPAADAALTTKYALGKERKGFGYEFDVVLFCVK
jgi:hypothetical protein